MKPIGFSIGEKLGKLAAPAFYEKLVAHSVMQHRYTALKKAPTYSKREELWASAVQHIGATQDILFLEFGVWEGYSMRYFSKAFTSSDARFYGFDSFEGLPQAWEDKSTGAFSTKGAVPQIADARIKFVKGWFQNSVPEFLKGRSKAPEKVLVHFDADLYSSTLYLLHALANYLPRYYFIFDEFPGDETRALYNFEQSHGATSRFFGKTDRSMQTFGLIENSSVYEPEHLRASEVMSASA